MKKMVRSKWILTAIIMGMIFILLPPEVDAYYHIRVEGKVTKIYKQRRTRGKIFWMASIKNDDKYYILKLLPIDICSKPAFKVGDEVVVDGVIPRIFLSQRVPIILVYKIYVKNTEESFVLRNKYGRINWIPAKKAEFYARVEKIFEEESGFYKKVKWVSMVVNRKGELIKVRLCPAFNCFNIPIRKGDLVKIKGYFPPYPEGQEPPPLMACVVEDKTSHSTLRIRDCKTKRPFWLREMR